MSTRDNLPILIETTMRRRKSQNRTRLYNTKTGETTPWHDEDDAIKIPKSWFPCWRSALPRDDIIHRTEEGDYRDTTIYIRPASAKEVKAEAERRERRRASWARTEQTP